MPSPSSVITRFELGSTFSEFNIKMNQLGYIGASVLRPRLVGKNAADVGKVPLKELLQAAGKTNKRAPGSGYNRDNFKFDKYSYSVSEYGKEAPLDDAQLAMYGDIIDAEAISADRAEDSVLAEYERDAAAAVYDTATWTGASLTTVGSDWTNASSGKPITDITNACEKVALGSAIEPNALIINKTQWRNFSLNAEIIDRIKYTQTPTQAQIASDLAGLFGLKYIFVAGGMGGGFKNTAKEGQAASISRIWASDKAMVCRVAESDDPQEPCIGRTFMWDGDGPGAPGDGGKLAVIMEQYREEASRSTVFRARNNRDIVIMYAAAGHLLTGLAG